MIKTKGRGGNQRFNALRDQLKDAREAGDDDKIMEIEQMLNLEFPSRNDGSPPTGEVVKTFNSRGTGAAIQGKKFKGVF